MKRSLTVLLGLALAMPVHAEAPAPTGDAQQIAKDILACQGLAFGSCPALSQAMASRDAVAHELAGQLKGATPQRAGLIALSLSLLDARTQVDALDAAAVALPDDPSTVDVRAAQARLGDVRAAPALLQQLNSTNPRSQILAAGGLGILRHGPAVAPMRKLLLTAAPRVQVAIAVALGMIGDASAEPELLALAGGPRTMAMVRAPALSALAALKSQAAVPLATMLVDAAPREVAKAALRVIAAAAAPWSDGAALVGLDQPGLRAEASEAIVALKMTSAGVHVLEAAVRDDIEPDERIALHKALGELKPSGAAVTLVRRLQKLPLKDEPDEAVRILRLLPTLADKSVVPDLVPLLRLDSKSLVNYVVFALEKLTGQRFGADEKPWREYAGLDAKPAKP